MAGEWQPVTLNDVADEVTVGHVGPMAHQYIDSGIPFLRSLNVQPFRINVRDLKYISRQFHEQLQKSALRPGDVVIVRTGKPGACAVIPDWLAEANCSDLVVIRASPKVRPAYISYVVNSSAGHHIDAHTVGAVQQHFNVASARQIQLNLPPVAEQDRILGVLGALDGKIELNRRMAETLEAMARALFYSLFVDFDPVRAKIEGQPTGLPEDVAALFPGSFGENGIPLGWRQAPIVECFDLLGGDTPKTGVPEYWGGNIPWFSVVDAPAESATFILATERTITELGLDGCAAGLLPIGATIISARGTVGKLEIVGLPMAMNQSCYAAVPKAGYSDHFVYFAIHHAIEELKAKSHG